MLWREPQPPFMLTAVIPNNLHSDLLCVGAANPPFVDSCANGIKRSADMLCQNRCLQSGLLSICCLEFCVDDASPHDLNAYASTPNYAFLSVPIRQLVSLFIDIDFDKLNSQVNFRL
jgi:hypothetical protein